MPRIQKIAGRTRQVLCQQVRGGVWVDELVTVHDGVEILLEEIAQGMPEKSEVLAAVRAHRGLLYVDVDAGLHGKLVAELAKSQRTGNAKDFEDEIKGARAAAAVTRG